jgi:hypothetical protein
MGLGGACRREELAKMTLNNINDEKIMLIVSVYDRKLCRLNIYCC